MRTGNCKCQRKKYRQEDNRIRKLLASEYCEFFEPILVESPFAETTRNSRGIRQVSLGLTRTRLIVAGDILKNNSSFICPRDLDPSIESFELISIYPLEYVTLSVFKRRHHRTLKARFIDGRAKYYEFAGMHRRRSQWRMWCEQVEDLLARKMDGSSLSETTAASSSSTTTLYLLSSDFQVRKRKADELGPTCRVWNRYGTAGDFPSWPEKDLYLGSNYNELTNGHYAPVPIRFAGGSLEDVRKELKDHSVKKIDDTKASRSWPVYQYHRVHDKNNELCNVLFFREENCKLCNCCATIQECIARSNNLDISNDKNPIDKRTLTRRVSRFGLGVPEKCCSGLVLGPNRRDHAYRDALRSQVTDNLWYAMESAVLLWENNSKIRERSSSSHRHLRRYAIVCAPHFYRALGPWSIQLGERGCIEGRRSMSLVRIRKQPTEPELRLPVSRRQLTTSPSCTTLQPNTSGSVDITTKGRVILFWTPDYWYRPKHAVDAYRELRRHLDHLKDFRQKNDHITTQKFFRSRKKFARKEERNSSTMIEEKSSRLFGRFFSANLNNKKQRKEEDLSQESNSMVQLRRLLRLDLRITTWDFDSSTLASQLTIIDRDLFVRVPAEEIRILAYKKTCNSAPNLGAWIAFAHRVSCLTTSEILAIRNMEMRTRIMARWINAAQKCFSMGNFQSCRSILAGLQAPPIYRLKTSWSHLRIRHSTRYATMEKLCKIYKNPIALAYRRAWAKAERNPPCIPYVGDLLMRILNLNSTVYLFQNNKQLSDRISQRFFSRPTQSSITNCTRISTIIDEDSSKKQNFGKRIFSMTLKKLKFHSKREISNVSAEKTVRAALKEDELARKYFYRWNSIVLKSKIKAREEERLRILGLKDKRILDIASWLIDCQRVASGYNFPLHSLAQEFLLKARYREDRDNFFLSIKIEPSKVT